MKNTFARINALPDTEYVSRTACQLAILMTCFALSLTAVPVCAHEGVADSHLHDESKDQPRHRAVLDKIDRLHTSVRQKLKRVLKRDKADDHSDASLQHSPPSLRQQPIRTIGSIPNDGRSVARQTIPSQVRRSETAGGKTRALAVSARDNQWPAPTNQRIDARSVVDPTQYRAAELPPFPDPRQRLPVSAPRAFANDSSPLDAEPLPRISRLPVPPGGQSFSQEFPQAFPQAPPSLPSPVQIESYPTESFDGFNDEPSIAGTRLGQAQITATERAMNLMRENQILKTARNTALTDNQQLREKLKSTQALLVRSDQAMTQARQALLSAEAANQQLRQKIVDTDAQHKKYLTETDRMLSALRDELDAVLVSEISFHEN